MAKDNKVRVNVTQDPEKPVEKNVLAAAILDISKALRALQGGGLTRDAIVTLIADRSKLGKGTVGIVLNNLEQLDRNFCR